MSDLATAVVSIASTKRRRFLWAAWWTGAPARDPFRKPDASVGGARSRAAALAAAEAAAGRSLSEIDGRWARAWSRVLVGQPPWSDADPVDAVRRPAPKAPASVWQILGVDPHASVAEIKRAFRQRALASHPDRGGDSATFQVERRAYDEAIRRRQRSKPRRKPGS